MMVRSQRHIKKFPVLRGIENAQLPSVLPMLKHTQNGILQGHLVKALPGTLNSRNEKNAIILKSLSDKPQDVELHYDPELVNPNKVRFSMKPYESVNIII